MPDATPSDALADYLNDPTAPVSLRLAKTKLATNVPTLLPADIVECDFDGYAPIVISDFYPVIDPADEVAEVVSNEVSFVGGDALATPQLVHAAYVTRHHDGDAVQLLEVVAYDPPLVMTLPGQSIDLLVRTKGVEF